MKTQKDKQMVIVDYDLPTKIKASGLVVKELCLNKQNIEHVLTQKCRYLILWFEEEGVGKKQSLECEICHSEYVSE